MSTRAVPRVDTGADRHLVVLVLVLAAAGWALLTLWHGSGAHGSGVAAHTDVAAHAGHVGHAGDTGDVVAGQAGTPTAAVPWLLGWTVMVVAMMLPPALPLLRVMRRLVAALPHRRWLSVTAGAGFLVVWVAVGAALLAAARRLGPELAANPVVQANPAALSGATILLAGAYQFTPLKQACLTACRSPVGVVLGSWSGTRPAPVEAALVGLRYGASCAGCCWALMVLTLAVGVAALPVMVVTGVLMALERLVPSSRRLVPTIAVAAIVLGVAVLTGLVPPGLIPALAEGSL